MKFPKLYNKPLILLKKFIGRVGRLRVDPSERQFQHHNKRVFRKSAESSGGPVVLVELNQAQSAHIAYSYGAETLSEHSNARIVAYAPRVIDGWLHRFFFKAKAKLGVEEFGVYRSLGASEFLLIKLTECQKRRAIKLTEGVQKTLKCKQDLVDLKIEGVWIGDLIYDVHLRTYNEPTIELSSGIFLKSLLESIQIFVFWNDYMESNDICGLTISHCVYNQAIPMRLAVKKGVPAFQANATHVYRLSERNLFAYNDFFYFRDRFEELPKLVKEEGLKQASAQIKKRFEGEVGVDMPYSKKSAYGSFQPKRLIAESQRQKVLIATHCFFDAPHAYGKNLFPDFYCWLEFLGELSTTTDYDWYIKTHPDYRTGTMKVIEQFLDRYPKFRLLPPSSSHHQIISEGIDVALTCYGTIGFEYAALGVPVINASVNNPHIAYNFNLHPKTIAEYRNVLLDLKNADLDIDKREVFEFYYMRHLFNTENLFFDDFERTIKELGGYSAQFSPLIYDKWIQEYSPDKHKRVKNALSRFVESGDFRMDYRHLDHEIELKSTGFSE